MFGSTDDELKPSEIFVTNGYPEYTFVERDKETLKEDLEDYLYDRGHVVSIFGPSKTGKTVLVQNSVKEGENREMARIAASEIDEASDVWKKAINNMGVPTEVEHRESTTNKGKLKVASRSSKEEEAQTINQTGYSKILEYRNNNNLDDVVIMIDDFHMLDSDLYPELGGLMKRASESGVKICVAQIESKKYDLSEHRDDLRITPLKVTDWGKNELMKIAKRGFEEQLNVQIPPKKMERLAEESAGSPFIMQTLCLDLCKVKGIEGKERRIANISLSNSELEKVFGKTVKMLPKNIEKKYKLLMKGGSGGGRTKRNFADGTTGDIFQAIIRALGENPPQRKHEKDDLEKRLVSVLESEDEYHNMGNIKQRCNTLQDEVSDDFFHFDDDLYELTIEDPRLLFYIRHNDKI